MRAKKFFRPFEYKGLRLKNRGVLSSMTRHRANEDGTVTPWMVDYYRQRGESAALVMTESCFINQKFNSNVGGAGMQTETHAKSWRAVIEEVHKVGAFIGAQVCHPGRALHPELGQPLGPSPIKAQGTAKVNGNLLEFAVPKELTEKEILSIISEFENSARVAKIAGFDLFELHGAYGQLCDQFLRDCSNQRKDAWGGSFENRCKFVLEVIDRVSKYFPYDRIGIKLSLVTRYQGMKDVDPIGLTNYLLSELNKRNVLFVHMVEAESRAVVPQDNGKDQIENVCLTFRDKFKNLFITNGSESVEERINIVENGQADMASFGASFVANPDLLERIKFAYPLSTFKPEDLYTPGPQGYCDFPKFDPSA